MVRKHYKGSASLHPIDVLPSPGLMWLLLYHLWILYYFAWENFCCTFEDWDSRHHNHANSDCPKHGWILTSAAPIASWIQLVARRRCISRSIVELALCNTRWHAIQLSVLRAIASATTFFRMLIWVMETVDNSPLHNLFVRNLKIAGLCDDDYPDDLNDNLHVLCAEQNVCK